MICTPSGTDWILFQSQGRFFGGCCYQKRMEHQCFVQFQSQGRFFGGCCCSYSVTIPTIFCVFQSQGRFFGGCCYTAILQAARDAVSFNRRGDSLGGAARVRHPLLPVCHRFNRRGDSLGGAAVLIGLCREQWRGFNRRGDSLGGAANSKLHTVRLLRSRFNRRGDSLGGAASAPRPSNIGPPVSIAGAILWGVLRGIPLNVYCR